jgi:hypothetical protein
MYLLALWLLSACDIKEQEDSKQTVQFFVETIDKIELEPEKLIEHCMELPDEERKEQCFLIGIDLLREKSFKKTETVCRALPPKIKSECFFRLAEKTLILEHCQETKGLEDQCYMHLLIHRLDDNKIKSFEQGVEVAERYSIPLHRGTYNSIYNYLLNLSKIVKINECEETRYPEICEEAAIILYRQRIKYIELTDPDPCNAQNRLPHFDHTVLKKEQSDFRKRVCAEK